MIFSFFALLYKTHILLLKKGERQRIHDASVNDADMDEYLKNAFDAYTTC